MHQMNERLSALQNVSCLGQKPHPVTFESARKRLSALIRELPGLGYEHEGGCDSGRVVLASWPYHPREVGVTFPHPGLAGYAL